jgi:hypothetical protein
MNATTPGLTTTATSAATSDPSEPHAAPDAAAGTAMGSLSDQLWSALHHERQSQGSATPGLPLAQLSSPDRDSSAYYVVTTVDGRGRLGDRSPLRILQWPPGHPVAVSVIRGAVLVVPRPRAPVAITRQGHLRLPLSVRHACRLRAGDRLLLVACPDRSLLVAYTMSALDAMVLAHHSTVPGEVPR